MSNVKANILSENKKYFYGDRIQRRAHLRRDI